MRKAALVAALLAGCSAGKERSAALAGLSARTPRERAAAVQALARLAAVDDDAAWAALARAAHDGSPAVRSAVADAASATKRDDALDLAGTLLRDPDDAVRLAAARGLGLRCGERAVAYLRMAFGRSSRAVRPELAAALSRCGVTLEQTLAKEEDARRAAASKLLESGAAAQRGSGARQLGRLGRAGDVAVLLGLLDERDGALVAAAASALGDAGALEAAPRLVKLLAEPGEVAGAAADALRSLGTEAVASARPALEAVAARADDEAESAALALASAPDPRLCAVAAVAQLPAAASVLARAGRCPAHPFVKRLEALIDSGGSPAAVASALEALVAAEGPAPEAAAALSKLLAGPEPLVLAAQAAGHLQAVGAGPALVALVRREREAIERDRATPHLARDPDDSGAAEVASQGALAPRPDREKYDRLMAKLGQHEGTAQAKASAQEQLATLLRGGPGVAQARRERLIAALRAARSLHAKGAEDEAARLAHDPDRLIAMAARGDEPPKGPAAPARGEPAATPALLWSDDGGERAAACAALHEDAATAPTRLALRHDPERRVRLACGATNETARPK